MADVIELTESEETNLVTGRPVNINNLISLEVVQTLRNTKFLNLTTPSLCHAF